MLRQASTIAYYTLLEALRNRLMWLLGLVLVIGIGLSGFLSDLAVTEQKETQVALLAAFLRFTAVFLMVIFVVTSLVREANDKGLELVLKSDGVPSLLRGDPTREGLADLNSQDG